ncbi:MAG: hypothetical protein ACRDIB_00385 [Ardenticatenaceae bacterium]
MTGHALPGPVLFRARRWGDLAAARLDTAWLGRVWESNAESLLLVDRDGEILRLVTAEIGDGPFHVVVEEPMAAHWPALPRGLYAWRVGRELWLGDDLTVRLPASPPWQSHLDWRQEATDVEEFALSRHLALLGDWLLARAPESTLAGLLPELLAVGAPLPQEVADRPYLPRQARLFRWRGARVLGELLPALETGDLAAAEMAVNRLAGLGGGMAPAGDWFMLGLVAGIQLWPDFLSEGSGLRADALLHRLVRSVTERTSLLARAMLTAALEQNRWDAPWHTLHATLLASGPYPDELRAEIERVASAWLARDEVGASAALAGLVAPFLWYQRFLL